jgi:dTDP-4-dehydrorhamnose reductase
MKILITGSDGYIGRSLYVALSKEYEVIGVNRHTFDLSNPFETLKYFSNQFFDVVIHCAIIGGSRLKPDSWKVLDHNISMYYNLLNCKNRFGKLINFGSGAEISEPDSPYGLSKRVIRNSISEIENFYNLRIYSVFDENELPTRFIKNSIFNYMNERSITIFKDIRMDFFYMPDLVKLVKLYITHNNIPNEIDCCYEYHPKLSEISNTINELSSYRVSVNINEHDTNDEYCGKFNGLGLEFIGLKNGILEVFNKMKSLLENHKSNYI